MTPKLTSILLVDDDEATNFYNQLIIESTGLVESIVIKQTGLLALEYLQSLEGKSEVCPRLIFLDINMPVMNGWEFLKAYQKTEACNKEPVIIVMLTTSQNPFDLEKADLLDVVQRFQQKPLTKEAFVQIVEEFFPESAKKAASKDKIPV